MVLRCFVLGLGGLLMTNCIHLKDTTVFRPRQSSDVLFGTLVDASGWAELYGITDQSIDPDLGLYEPISILEASSWIYVVTHCCSLGFCEALAEKTQDKYAWWKCYKHGFKMCKYLLLHSSRQHRWQGEQKRRQIFFLVGCLQWISSSWTGPCHPPFQRSAYSKSFYQRHGWRSIHPVESGYLGDVGTRRQSHACVVIFAHAFHLHILHYLNAFA